jgi:hypothetical protein
LPYTRRFGGSSPKQMTMTVMLSLLCMRNASATNSSAHLLVTRQAGRQIKWDKRFEVGAYQDKFMSIQSVCVDDQ